jgi:predicted lipoprotein with Yx(FWY)xxD motif
MKSRILLGMLLVLALTLSACAPAPIDATPTEIPMTEPATLGVPVTGDADVQVSETSDFGPILVNGEGMSLYGFMGDMQGSGTSACTDECAAEWPPLTVEGDPVAGEGVDETLLGTLTRDDGSTQVTYDGWPLYLFTFDTTAGDTNGQGVTDEFGLWHLISPSGEHIEQ